MSIAISALPAATVPAPNTAVVPVVPVSGATAKLTLGDIRSLPDAAGTHQMSLRTSLTLAGNTTLTINCAANNTLTINGSVTLDQDVGTANSPTFAGVYIHTGAIAQGHIGCVNVLGVDCLEITGGGAVPAISLNCAMLGLFGYPPVTQPELTAMVNNVTAGGGVGIISNFSDLTVYANSASTIRNDIYQLAFLLQEVKDALASYGLIV